MSVSQVSQRGMLFVSVLENNWEEHGRGQETFEGLS